jgi:two-component system sensor histidine kinase/response regulator
MINDLLDFSNTDADKLEVAQPSSELARLPALILVAEDNRVNQQIARHLLESLGYRVDIVSTGHEAVAAVTTKEYAAVLMDIQMPEMDGWTATAEIRRRAGTVHRIPIIALTAHELGSERERYLAPGMDDYLSKPLDLQALDVMLKRWVIDQALVQVPANSLVPDVPHVSKALDEAALDSTILANLRNLEATSGKTILAKLAALFSRATPPRLASLRSAIAASEVALVNQEAHTLKGSCLNLGARRMAGLCSDLEAQGQAGDLVGAASLLTLIEAEFEHVCALLEQENL